MTQNAHDIRASKLLRTAHSCRSKSAALCLRPNANSASSNHGSLPIIETIVEGGSIRKKIDILGSKIGKHDTPTPDHESWLRNNHNALAEAERRVPAHTNRIDVIARDRDIGDTADLL